MRTLWEMILENFEDTILQVLIAAAVVSLVTGYLQHGVMGLLEGGAILISIIIIMCVNSGNNYVKEK
jgi:magnesium-transporting ATPase (P-type)